MAAFDSLLTKMMISAFFYPKTLLFICFFIVFICAAAVFLLIRQHKNLLTAEERLNLAEETLESFPDGYYLWLYDPIGFIRETHCSRRLAVMMDLSQGTDSSFDALLEHFTPDSAETLNAALNEMRAGGRPFMLELQNTTRTKSFLVSGFRTYTTKYK